MSFVDPEDLIWSRIWYHTPVFYCPGDYENHVNFFEVPEISCVKPFWSLHVPLNDIRNVVKKPLRRPFRAFLATCDPLNPCIDLFLVVFASRFYVSNFILLILSRKPLISRFRSIIWSKKAFLALFALFDPFWPLMTPWTPVVTFSWLYLRCAFIFQILFCWCGVENP